MQEAQVSIISNSDCRGAYGQSQITADMLCAQGANSDGDVTDACQGDSGGPLVCASGGASYVLHGATSWGYGCADQRYPGIWSRVSYVRDWIDELMGVTGAPTPSTPAPPPTPSPSHMWADIVGECTLDGACVQSENYPQPYGNNQKCTITIDVSNAAPIVVESFDVESYFDYLTVDGGARYTGSSGPSGVTLAESVLWSSDFSVTRSGWRFCMPVSTPAPPPTVAPTPAPTASPTAAPPTAAPTEAPTASQTAAPTAAPTAFPTAAPTAAPTLPPTPSPTAAPTPGSAHMWAAISGPCTLDGSCVQSANYPQPYGNDQKCTVTIDASNAAPIVVESFDVESYFDYLVVDGGATYTGSSGPSAVTPTSSILWSSDFSVTRSGWKFCMPVSTPAPPPTAAPTPALTAPPTPAPTAAPGSGSMWGAISGPCVQDGACVQSPNYPHYYYSNNQQCTIEINAASASPIIVEYFNVEWYFDYLLVDGWKFFSGRRRRPHGFTRRPASCGRPTPASRGACGDCASPVAALWRRPRSPTSPPRSWRQPPSPRRWRSRRTRRRGGWCSFERGAKSIAWPTPESRCPRQRGLSRCDALGTGHSQRAAGSFSDVSARWTRGCLAPRCCGRRRFQQVFTLLALVCVFRSSGAGRASHIHRTSGLFLTDSFFFCSSASLPHSLRLGSAILDRQWLATYTPCLVHDDLQLGGDSSVFSCLRRTLHELTFEMHACVAMPSRTRPVFYASSAWMGHWQWLRQSAWLFCPSCSLYHERRVQVGARSPLDRASSDGAVPSGIYRSSRHDR
ncbi:unnamed protein product [Prorocentrum cordatum]|uniref:Peptidase S1 domain-containing protein n=1 Tax=Prorocentrum cordatum TaxID=2364126 RepID=A0ABN9WBA8_9DINO|nr:unnamed protein product [Polarella glacialis]